MRMAFDERLIHMEMWLIYIEMRVKCQNSGLIRGLVSHGDGL